MSTTEQQADSRIPITVETRKKLATLKVGGERYNELIERMIEQYDQEKTKEYQKHGV